MLFLTPATRRTPVLGIVSPSSYLTISNMPEGCVKAVDLHIELIKRLQGWKPSRQTRRTEGGVLRDIHGPFEERRRRRCLLHYWLSGASRSITLRPLPRPVEPAPSTPALAAEGIIQIQQAGELGVQVALRVSRDDFDARAWAKWILAAPSGARNLIKIERFFGSFSQLVLVRLPAQVWSLLPESPAVSFVGFTTTGNYGPALEKEVDEKSLGPVGDPRLPTGKHSLSIRPFGIRSRYCYFEARS